MGPEDIPDVSEILTWPQAVFGVGVLLVVVALPSVLSWLGTRQVRHEMHNNSGSTMRDAVDRIESTLTAHVEQARADQESNEERLEALENRPRGLFRR